jgi:hypothetical protein
MDDRIGHLVANAGVDRTAAENTVAIILQFLTKEEPTEQVCAPTLCAPGAETATALDSGTRLRSPSTLGAIGFAPETAGDTAVGVMVGAIPGLGRLA